VTGPDPDREIYPNAPLKLVAFEYRFESIQLDPAMLTTFRDRLADEFPVVGTPPQQVVITPTGASASSSGARCFDAERRRSVLLTPESLGVETSRYTRFEDFRQVIATTIDALIEIGVPLTPLRVGLRYIDEIDEQALPSPVRWSTYIEPALARAIEHFAEAPAEYQAATLFEPAKDQRVLLRYGVMRQPAVDPAGPLVIDRPPRGRYFLIDIDSSWNRLEPVTVTTDKEWLLDMLGTLHSPIRDLFERTVTDALRDQFLRTEPT
jgi:uncharacterized protein (TIGR04255 family)